MASIYNVHKTSCLKVQTDPVVLEQVEKFWGSLRCGTTTPTCTIPTSFIQEEIRIGKVPAAVCTNCVSTFFLGTTQVDLENLSMRFPFISLDKNKFSAAVAKLININATILIFRSGNAVCTGPKGIFESLQATHMIVHLLRKGGAHVTMQNFKMQNMVFVSQLDHGVNLAKLAADYGSYVNYEPQLFPGLVFRTGDIQSSAVSSCKDNTKVVLNFFCSGKLVITGCRCIEESMQAYRWAIHHMMADDYKLLKNMKSSHYISTHKSIGLSDKVEAYVQEITLLRTTRPKFIQFPTQFDNEFYVPTTQHKLHARHDRSWWLTAWKRSTTKPPKKCRTIATKLALRTKKKSNFRTVLCICKYPHIL